MIKKIATFMMGIGLIASSSLAFVSAQGNAAQGSLSTAAGGFGLNAGVSDGIKGVKGTGQDGGEGLMTVVRNAINWVLGLLGLITFVLLLWGGFNMVTAAGDDKKFGEGLKILKNAGIGLVFIAVSWLLVSMLFWIIGTVVGS
jgi:hypothetical protein